MAIPRLFRFVTASVLLLVMAVPAHAQPHLRVSGGTAMPLSPDFFADAAAPGVTVELGPQFRLTDPLAVTVSIVHGRFPVIGTDVLDAGAMTAWALTGRFLIHVRSPASSVRPYVTFGGGPYRLNRTPERVAIVCLRSNQPSHVTGPCPSPQLRTRDGPEMWLGVQAGLGATIALTPTLHALVELIPTGLLSHEGELLYTPIQLGFRYHPMH